SSCYCGFTLSSIFFFLTDTATTEIYTLSLHDALPICQRLPAEGGKPADAKGAGPGSHVARAPEGTTSAPVPSAPLSPQPSRPSSDRKSTRLNSSHLVISYAVFCLKKKKR